LRKQVGCVIIKNNRVIGSGYNGSVITGKHCSELQCEVEKKCTHSIHAEANALMACLKSGISVEGGTIYCTTAPCYDCAKLIVQSGIIEVVYDKEYTNGDGEFLLESMGISVTQLLMYAK